MSFVEDFTEFKYKQFKSQSQFKTDQELKEAAKQYTEKLYWELVNSGYVPIKRSRLHPNKTTEKAIKDVRAGKVTRYRTVDELFKGDKAEMAKQRAASVATMMQVKFSQ